MPDNLGYPINSPAKELGIYVQGDNETAYFASARKGGLGGLDIYKVNLPDLFRPQPMVQLEAMVIDQKTGAPINTEVKIGNNGNTWTVNTHQNGWFFMCLAGNAGYSFQIHKDGYKPYINAVYLEPQDNRSNHIVQIQLIKLTPPASPAPEELTAKTPYVGTERLTKTVVQVFFDFDSASINTKGHQKLEKVSDLMSRYDDWSVEVVGFADNTGDESYNKTLSQQRADEVVRFLKDKSTAPIATNIKVVSKGATGMQDNEESRQKSRRVDIVLTR